MVLYELIRRHIQIKKRTFIALGCISGLANALVLALINNVAANISDINKENHILYYLVLFTLTIAIYGFTQQRLMTKAAQMVERAIDKLRVDLFESIRHTELSTLEKIGKERIFNTISKELQTISQSAQLFVIIGQSISLVFFTSLYIAWHSFVAFMVISTLILVGASIHRLRANEIQRNMRISFESENQLIQRLSDLLDGFKEVKLSEPRAEDLEHEYRRDSNRARRAKTKTQTLFATDFILSQITFFAATGAMVFIVPMLSDVYTDVVIKVTTASLFLIGPITSIVGGIPVFTTATEAAQNVLALERDLKNVQDEQEVKRPEPSESLTSFSAITLAGAFYQHQKKSSDRPFAVGPVDITFEQGKITFITGGNGSGKTTFIRMLTGLYELQSGQILLNGKAVTEDNRLAYRSLFTAVFADFHLFQQLYGIRDLSTEEIDEWLDFLEMRAKVGIQNGAFSTIDLSSGQRKRLALLSTILENRPIYIFDEWAADQDPIFRRKFYEQVLPRLKARGNTIIAITHDDAYFHLADVHLKMEEGQLLAHLDSESNGVPS
ncbi:MULTISPECIES: cyclic peptide export ABC transporter [unclassified Pseudoalteromonas]|uniref:cyclic peptide export ABC transporter n=1 Tax=unclassified Pseudoalteromonas TaxID=194690 RepID=UPI0019D2029A|nr:MULTISPECIES: cyclic peptide export ABC transporter [unclassified Pseudoalteromonas]MBR8844903.1 cyclic peptide export ABC transporter [Pseudoalteromonas sp. JC3]MCG7553076.1 cyclic peptide export ABC transporter [Pseudoalteromonas sp. Of11M-6]WJE08465.1 cyclic peptide export ABC transporter [Pseudoalteromonas sp. JC3]